MHDIPCVHSEDTLSPSSPLQVDRKQLSTDWRKRLRVIQAKAAELPQAPSVGDTLLDFFAIRDTRDRLAAGAERNLLGQLKGDAAEWHRLVGAYEQKGEYGWLSSNPSPSF